MTATFTDDLTPIGAARPDAVVAGLREIDGRTVAWFELSGRTTTSTGAAEAEVVQRVLETAGAIGCPVVGVVSSVAVEPGPTGLEGLVAWGRVAATATRLSGVVPILIAVTGPVHGSLAPVLGLADHLVMTVGATAYVNGPAPVSRTTGVDVSPDDIGGLDVHASGSGLVSLTASDHADAEAALSELLDHLPDNHLSDAPHRATGDDPRRSCAAAAAVVPPEPHRSYDVREVVADVVDRDSLLEVHPHHAPNLVTAYARLDGAPVAVVANQPDVRAGTLDIQASVKGARHVQSADAFGLPIITFVDTPGYQPGRDIERRGMIRHGAKLVHAYAAATVPRMCVILRKAYGGAYIVMDSRTMGSDLVVAWPGAEIAVMGAAGAVGILHREETDPVVRAELENQYRASFCTPRIAAERGLVDDVIDPSETRRVLTSALPRFRNKRPVLPARKHDNQPI